MTKSDLLQDIDWTVEQAVQDCMQGPDWVIFRGLGLSTSHP